MRNATIPGSHPQVVEESLTGLLKTADCICDGAFTHRGIMRPCPQHATSAYLVWEEMHNTVQTGVIKDEAQRVDGYYITWKNIGGRYHRLDGLPARVMVDQDGTIYVRKYYVNGEMSADDNFELRDLLWCDDQGLLPEPLVKGC